jgi:hypothetical protein
MGNLLDLKYLPLGDFIQFWSNSTKSNTYVVIYKSLEIWNLL